MVIYRITKGRSDVSLTLCGSLAQLFALSSMACERSRTGQLRFRGRRPQALHPWAIVASSVGVEMISPPGHGAEALHLTNRAAFISIARSRLSVPWLP